MRIFRHASSGSIRGFYECSSLGWRANQVRNVITQTHRGHNPAKEANANETSSKQEQEPKSLSSEPELIRTDRTGSLLSSSRRKYTTRSLHNSLETFLHYAAQTNLSPKSTVFRGTKYEYTCLNTLSRLGFELHRTGGANDAGMDLFGRWNLPGINTPLDALVQCKFFVDKPVAPVFLRELKGTASRESGTLSDDALADDVQIVSVLATPGLATKAVRQAVKESQKAIVLATIDEEGWLDAIVWNKAMQDLCEEVKIGMRYVDGRKQAVLLINDLPWEETSKHPTS